MFQSFEIDSWRVFKVKILATAFGWFEREFKYGGV